MNGATTSLPASIAPPNLYSLEKGFADLTALMESIDEHGADEDAGLIVGAWLAKLDGDMRAKLESAGKYLRMQEAAARAADEEVERLRARSAATKRRVTRMKDAIGALLGVANMTRVEAGTFTFAICTNGGPQPIEVDDVDPHEVAAGYPDLVVTTTALNGDAVRKTLEAGNFLPFARVKPRGQHLRIK